MRYFTVNNFLPRALMSQWNVNISMITFNTFNACCKSDILPVQQDVIIVLNFRYRVYYQSCTNKVVSFPKHCSLDF